MCKNRESAEQDCLIVYGHTNVSRPDVGGEGDCFYAAKEDLVWVVHPMDDADEDGHGVGVMGVRDGAQPICQLADKAAR